LEDKEVEHDCENCPEEIKTLCRAAQKDSNDSV